VRPVPKQVTLSGYYGFGNTGDEALLLAIVTALRERLGDDVRFTVLSAEPGATGRAYDVAAVGRTDAIAIWRRLAGTDLFISGGGSLLQDVTSDRSLGYYLGLIALARRLCRHVMVYGQGIGPVRSLIGRAWLRRTLRGVDAITVRDRESYELLVRAGVTRPRLMVTADPTLGLDLAALAVPEAGRQVLAGAGVPEGPRVGISVRPWRDETGYAGAVARLAGHVSRRFGAAVFLFPMQYPADVAAARRLAAAMTAPATVVDRPLSLAETASVIGGCDLLIGMRLHALIFAAALGVAFLGLAYDPKVLAFARMMEQDQAAAPLDSLSPADLLLRLESVWRGRREIGRSVRERARILGQRALVSADVAVDLLTAPPDTGAGGGDEG